MSPVLGPAGERTVPDGAGREEAPSVGVGGDESDGYPGARESPVDQLREMHWFLPKRESTEGA